MARDPHTKDCAIKGCTFARFKGDLCRKHYALVPWQMRHAVASEVMSTGHRIAQKHHRRQLAYVRRVLAS